MEAIVAFSGGQDSTTVLAKVVEEYGADKVYALTADYGQRHVVEIDAARAITEMLGVRNHEVVHLGNILHGKSPLTDPTEQLETYASPEEMESIIGNRREVTFVPMRNPLFLTIAANRAAVLGARRIYTGVCQMDNANYDDCREVFIDNMERMIYYALGTDHRADSVITIETPLINMSKAESVLWSLRIRGAYEALAWSHTAYSGEYPPLTQDHATVLRAQGFAEANVPDPLILRAVYNHLMKMPMGPNYIMAAVELKKVRDRDGDFRDLILGVLSNLREVHGIKRQPV